MYLLGHLGLTAAGLRLSGRDLPLRWAFLMALLPDLIDKPVRALWPELVNHNTRGLAHSLGGALVVLAVLIAAARRPLLLWACYLGHFVLDRMWLHDGPRILLWPLLGPFPPPVGEVEVMRRFWRYNLAGEAAGLSLLLFLWWRSRRRSRT